MKTKEKIERLKNELEKAEEKLGQHEFFVMWLKGQISVLKITEKRENLEKKK